MRAHSGVWFRRYTCEFAKDHGIHGWVRNTSQRTVEGEAEGSVQKLESFKEWLRTTGSPASRIDRVEFKDLGNRPSRFQTFEVRH